MAVKMEEIKLKKSYYLVMNGEVHLITITRHPRSLTGFGFIMIGLYDLFPLTQKEMINMYKTREEAERYLR